MCVCTCMCVYVCMHVKCMCVYACMYANCPYTCTCGHMRKHVYIGICVFMNINVWSRMNIQCLNALCVDVYMRVYVFYVYERICVYIMDVGKCIIQKLQTRKLNGPLGPSSFLCRRRRRRPAKVNKNNARRRAPYAYGSLSRILDEGPEILGHRRPNSLCSSHVLVLTGSFAPTK